ncbi:IS3 family transposase [Micromonospora echinaurantiaca]|uniref:IS3 family transposase n=1 Tax=Micromonospora echinaurantiaca TaxID=47857 RepID=UPI00370FC247
MLTDPPWSMPPAVWLWVAFIDAYREQFGGVEPICRVLTGHGMKIAASTYYKAKAMPPSARAVRAEIMAETRRVHPANYGVYGARKIWIALRRDGHQVARCTVERLMRQAGLAGVVRGRKIRTTITDPAGERAQDLVQRDFTAQAPDTELPTASVTVAHTWPLAQVASAAE